MEPTESLGELGRALFEQSSFSTVLYDAEGHLLAANAAFRTLWGVDVSSAPADYSVLTDPELARQGVIGTISRAFAGERVVSPAARYDIAKVSLTGEGRSVWTEGHFFPVRDRAGRVTHVVLMHVDVTDRMRAEEAVARTSRLQALTAELATALTPLDVARVVVHHGLAAVGAAAGSLAVLDGGRGEFTTLASEGYPEAVARGYARYPLRAGRPVSDTVLDGVPRYIESYEAWSAQYPDVHSVIRSTGYPAYVALPVRAGAIRAGLSFSFGQPRGFGAEDRSLLETIAAQAGQALERARLFESERAARADAESASRAKSDFLAKMSHELRTPLNAIAGHAELIEIGVHGPITPPQRDALERVRRNQRHLLGLISDILDFSKIEAGAVRLELEKLDVRDVLESIEPLVGAQLVAKGVSYSILRGERPLLVRGDRDRILQVCLNLISNALKATSEGGSVEVWAELVGRRVVIRVRDTGTGIPAERLEDIFSPFVQLGRTFSSPSQGVGLGLAISRELARAMGGDVTVQSTVGVGSTFTLSLPALTAG